MSAPHRSKLDAQAEQLASAHSKWTDKMLRDLLGIPHCPEGSALLEDLIQDVVDSFREQFPSINMDKPNATRRDALDQWLSVALPGWKHYNRHLLLYAQHAHSCSEVLIQSALKRMVVLGIKARAKANPQDRAGPAYQFKVSDVYTVPQKLEVVLCHAHTKIPLSVINIRKFADDSYVWGDPLLLNRIRVEKIVEHVKTIQKFDALEVAEIEGGIAWYPPPKTIGNPPPMIIKTLTDLEEVAMAQGIPQPPDQLILYVKVLKMEHFWWESAGAATLLGNNDEGKQGNASNSSEAEVQN